MVLIPAYCQLEIRSPYLQKLHNIAIKSPGYLFKSRACTMRYFYINFIRFRDMEQECSLVRPGLVEQFLWNFMDSFYKYVKEILFIFMICEINFSEIFLCLSAILDMWYVQLNATYMWIARFYFKFYLLLRHNKFN